MRNPWNQFQEPPLIQDRHIANTQSAIFSRPFKVGDRVNVSRSDYTGIGTIIEISDDLGIGGGTKVHKAFLISTDDGFEKWFSGVSLTRIAR